MVPNDESTILDVRGLTTRFHTRHGMVSAVDDVSFTIARGEVVGIVGESGSGKSVSVMSVLKLIHEPPGRIENGSVGFGGRDLLLEKEQHLRTVRGNEIAFIFQDPNTSLNPVLTVGAQFEDVLHAHRAWKRGDAREFGVRILEETGVNSPSMRWDQYPHELSGGMKQRVLIAMAIANEPQVLIADEATTALDATTQASIVDLLKDLNRKRGLSIIFISHDLGLISEIADRVIVMYAGKIVEQAPVVELFDSPQHPYTVGLLASRPRPGTRHSRFFQIPGVFSAESLPESGCSFAPRCGLSGDRDECQTVEPGLVDLSQNRLARCHFVEEVGGFASSLVLESDSPGGRHRPTGGTAVETDALRFTSVSKVFGGKQRFLRSTERGLWAVDDVSFSVPAGRTMALVGESGSGKSTAGRLASLFLAPTLGEIQIFGKVTDGADRDQLKEFRTQVQMIFQNPYGSLNPRMRVFELLQEPLLTLVDGTSSSEREHRIAELMSLCGLQDGLKWRHPSELSGGQRQRIAIARALASSPRLLILDEPVSALDVSVQAKIINLLKDLQEKLDLTLLFITHDLSVVHGIADSVAVMYSGKIVEQGDRARVLDHPSHPYTKALVSSAPVTHPRDRDSGSRIILQGDIPDAMNPPSGCRFRTRCWKAVDRCAEEMPVLAGGDPTDSSHLAACHFPETYSETV